LGQRIVIIGGVACGLKAASRARRLDGQADITVIEQGRHISYAACGMPYVISGRIKKVEDLVQRTPAYFERLKGIRMLTGCRATAIDRGRKVVRYLGGAGGEAEAPRELPYDKLVLATGARPVAPPLPGLDLPGVFRLKDLADTEAILKVVCKAKRAVIIGAGPIGVEMAEAFRARGLEVVLIEARGQLLPGLLDFEMARLLERHLTRQGVDVRCGAKLLRFEGEEGLARVVTSSEAATEAVLEADLALLAIGVRPNVELAREAGLAIGQTGAIKVDDHLRTSDPDIYAGGDCAEMRHLLTGKPVYIPLGTTANKHGRVIADNICGGGDTFPGVMGTALLKAFDYTVGRSGLTAEAAREAGFDAAQALVPAPDHAHYYGGAQAFALKLICERPGGRLLGVQIVGPGEVAGRLDTAVAAMSFGATAEQLSKIDFGYSPPFAQAMDALIVAANVARNKLAGVASVLPEEVRRALDGPDAPLLVDVRGAPERQKARLGVGEVVHLPFPQLRKGMAKLPKDRDLITFCWGGQRAYEAALILRRSGFERVRFMDGSLFTWPYELEEDDPGWR
jgi:NADPH-dependent 2,4-dienoyl-CoA reductase/sulfur reductase-like enzyme/rhodanese-related sulfurtransferase